MNEQATEVLAFVSEAEQVLAKCDSPQVMSEAKVDVRRLQFRFKAVEQKAKALTSNITEKFDKMASDACDKAMGALRKEARGQNQELDASGLFAVFSDSGNEIKE